MSRRSPLRGVGAGSIRPTPRSGRVAELDETISSLVDLDASGLCLQWRDHLGGTPPAHLPKWLLLRILTYRLQAAAFGGLDRETLRILRQPRGQRPDSPYQRPFETRMPTTSDGASLLSGALLTRQWNGKLEHVMVLEKGFAWKGETYGSLSQVAKAITGTSWNGHRFFGLRTEKPSQSAIAGRRSKACDTSPIGPHDKVRGRADCGARDEAEEIALNSMTERQGCQATSS
jgi:Protein of unknown function (DUF2924)